MDLYEACENGNEERVVEMLVYGEDWRGLTHHHNVHRHSSHHTPSTTSAPPSPNQDGTGSGPGTGFRSRVSKIHSSLVMDASVPVEALAAKANDLAAVAASTAGLVLSPTEMLRTRGTAGRTPLLAACLGGQLGVIRLLLGESCVVYFTSRSFAETEALLRPLAQEYAQFTHTQAAYTNTKTNPETASPALFQVTMTTKDGGSDLVPVARVQFPPHRAIAAQDLLEGHRHVDVFGNTPLQCVSCFGCGSTEKHIDDGLEITKQLLVHGDQPNLPKIANQWTPLHWAAYNGNHEQCAILLNPSEWLSSDENSSRRVGKTQISIPLLVNSDNLFAADVAGRRGLAVAKEMREIQQLPVEDRNEYATWRLRLDHLQVLTLFTQEFVAHAASLVQYVNEMNARLPQQLAKQHQQHKQPTTASGTRRRRKFTCADAIRYGQHLLYWVGCFGLVQQVRALLEMKLEMPVDDATTLDPKNAKNPEIHKPFVVVHLRPLYVCSCEENKRQSVLHAVAVHGQQEIVELLLRQMLFEQQQPIHARLQHHKTERMAKKKASISATVSPALDTAATAATATATDAGQQLQQQQQDDKTRLDVLPLTEAGGGWRNYRNESPLFLATLFLRNDVVTVFHSFLSSSSLSWELANCNVEGSFIHHVANDFARRLLLTIDDQSSAHRHLAAAAAEYVLLFDGLHKKQFKETIIESMREESVVAPSLVITRAGATRTQAALCGLVPATQTDYVIIGATEAVLVHHAQALQLKIKHRGSALRSKYNATSGHLFEPFRSLQRQQVVLDIIQKNVQLKKHLQKANLKAIFPLHDASGCKNIMRHWAFSDQDDKGRRRLFQPFVGTSLRQFLLERRTHQYEMLWPLLTYFGEKHAFYYAFMLFYTVWLLLIAVPGVLCQLLWSLGSDHLSYVAPLFSIVVSVWATLFVERWKRKKSEIQSNFGNFKRNRSEQAPAFYGDFQVRSPEKAVVDTTFPKSLQLLRIYVGLPLLFTMASLAVAIFIGVKLSSSSSAILETLVPWMPRRVTPYSIPVVNAVCMLVLDNVYTQVAVALTQWENHRTVWQFESMLATKLFWFKFLNAFISLFWVAFIDKDAAALRKQLVIIMGARQIWFAIQRSFVPLVQVAHAWKKAGFRLGNGGGGDVGVDAPRPVQEAAAAAAAGRGFGRSSWFSVTHEWYYAELVTPGTGTVTGTGTPSVPVLESHTAPPPPPPPIVVLQELMQAPDFLMGKQMEVVLQFGYITMFVSVLPCAPLLALVSNVVSTRLDVICCTQAKRRPPFESETEVSTFMSILEFMSFAAVAVNCAVLFFTTVDDFESLLEVARTAGSSTSGSGYYLDKLWVLLVIEHVVLGLKALLSLTIDDAATWVQNDEDRHDDEAKQNAQREKARLGLMATASPSSSSRLGEAGETECAPPSGGQRASGGGGAITRVLQDKYEAAVSERDASLERERRLERQLESVRKRLAAVALGGGAGDVLLPSLTTTTTPTDAEYGDGISPQALGPLGSTSTVTNSRCCLICHLLVLSQQEGEVPAVQVAAQKRCLSCRQFFCIACDETVHLDDLGVREAKHFRLNVPCCSEAAANERDNQGQPTWQVATVMDQGEEPAAIHGSQDDDELVQLLTSYVQTSGVAQGKPLADVGQTVEMLRARCEQHQPVVLRYLRNVQRRSKYARHSTKLEPITVR